MTERKKIEPREGGSKVVETKPKPNQNPAKED